MRKLPEISLYWTTNWEFRLSGKARNASVYAGCGDYSGGTSIDRSEFISVFLSSALSPGNGDGDYVRARVEVAKFVSQEYLSGPNGPGVDLVAILDGVTNAAQAQAAIDALIDTYGPAPAAVAELLSFRGVDAADQQQSFESAGFYLIDVGGSDIYATAPAAETVPIELIGIDLANEFVAA